MISKGSPNNIREFLKKELPDVEVALKYLGITQYPTLRNSPLRKDDKPSFSLFLAEDHAVMYKDFATGESGNLYGLLEKLWNTDYAGVLKRIYKDFSDSSVNPTLRASLMSNSPNKYEKSKCRLQVKVRGWKKHDLEFWSSFGISLPSLKMAEVYPISHTIYVSESGNSYVFKSEKYAYVYVERRGEKVYLKVYQPFSKTNKWRSSTDASVWNLETKIPSTGETVILTSSLKDSLNLWENLGIPAVCMQGEGYMPDKQKMEDLKKRFLNVIVFFDNDYRNPDNPGKTFSEKLTKEFNVPHVLIPEKYGAKDPSDLYRKIGKEEYIKVVSKLIDKVTDWE